MVDMFMKPKYTPLKERGSLWTDVEPILQFPTADGKAPICPVAYSPDYEDLMNHFRAVLNADELSERAYNLCAEVLSHNAGDYNAWAHRRKCVDALGQNSIEEQISMYSREIAYVNSVGIKLEKNFQIWHHRRCIIEMYGTSLANDPEKQKDLFKREKLYLDKIFTSDTKNYHAWSYRLWIVERFNLFDGEL